MRSRHTPSDLCGFDEDGAAGRTTRPPHAEHPARPHAPAARSHSKGLIRGARIDFDSRNGSFESFDALGGGLRLPQIEVFQPFQRL